MQVECNRCLMYVMIKVAIMIVCLIILNRYVLFLNPRHTNCISDLFLLVQMSKNTYLSQKDRHTWKSLLLNKKYISCPEYNMCIIMDVTQVRSPLNTECPTDLYTGAPIFQSIYERFLQGISIAFFNNFC